MIEVTLGKTGITVNKNGFGALPIQRISKDDAVKLLRRAYEGGIHFLIPQGLTQTAKKRWERRSLI